jgi:hypothetical protein
MADERDKLANDPHQDEEVEGHKFSGDEGKLDKLDSSEDDEADEVEAHKL